MLPKWNSGNIKHFLHAHKLLTQDLIEYSGHWRSGGVGIYRDKQLLHMAPPAERVPILMQSLFNWLTKTDIHPLIKSCIFHYELAFIHPFLNGNGRMGRLWQTLILSEWRKELSWLPVETVVCENQEYYYQTLRKADSTSDCTCFIDFMLSIINNSLKASIPDSYKTNTSEEMSEEVSVENKRLSKTALKILMILQNNPTMTIQSLANQVGVTTRTVERNIKLLQEYGRLRREGSTKAGHWLVINK